MKKLIVLAKSVESHMEGWQRFHFTSDLQGEDIDIDFLVPEDYTTVSLLLSQINEMAQGKEIIVLITCESVLFQRTFFESIRGVGYKSVLLCFDNMHAPYMYATFIKYVDLVWLTSRENEETIRGLGAKKLVFMPYASSKYFSKFLVDKIHPGNRGVLWYGNLYGSRNLLLNEISKVFPVFVVGSKQKIGRNSKFSKPRFADVLQYIHFGVGRKLLMARLIALVAPRREAENTLAFLNADSYESLINHWHNHRMVVNSTYLRHTYKGRFELHKLHLRTWELASAGVVQLVPKSSKIEEYFEHGYSILSWNSHSDLENIHKEYFDDLDQLDLIGARAKEIVLANHRWYHRFDKLFELL